MATNGGGSVGETEMSECDGGEVVTMMDVLKEQQEFEDDANAVLGGSDDKECTYSQGYIKRQAIYACMTCCPESKENASKRAGFCLACSLTCHENHDLVELYTKRNFRCDCGNPKFKSPCQFTPNKPDLNDENIYNQNFVGLYCICSQPYGEQENALDDEMIQCVICEDWWHAAHLEAIVPAHDQFSEMVCKLCMAKNEFLHSYSDLTVNVESVDVDVINTNGVDSTITDENLTNGSTVDNLTYCSIDDVKVVNGSGVDETIEDDSKSVGEVNNTNQEELSTAMETSTNEAPVTNNDNEPSSSETESNIIDNTPNDASESNKSVETDQEIGNDMETSINEAPVIEDEPVSNNDNEASSSEKESIDPNKADNDASESKKSRVTDQEITSTDALMNTTEDKIEEKSFENVNEPLHNNESDPAGDKLEETNAISTVDSTEKTEETNEAHAEEGKENPIEEGKVKLTTDPHPDKSKDNDSLLEATTNILNTELPAETENSTKDESRELEKALIEDVDTTNAEVKKSDDLHSESEVVEDDTTHMQEDTTSKVDEIVDTFKEPESTNNIEINESVVAETVGTEKRKLMEDDTENSPAKKPKIDGKQCTRPKGVKKVHKGATFWPSDFRQKLCMCNECISMYKDLSVLFLTDLEDTVTAYETLGKERTAGKPNQYEKGIEALCSLGRIQQIDALTEYNKMRDKLITFLQSFKEKKEIVTEHDIKTFFAGMKPQKRNDGVYFCG